jgi:hypothetical protein
LLNVFVPFIVRLTAEDPVKETLKYVRPLPLNVGCIFDILNCDVPKFTAPLRFTGVAPLNVTVLAPKLRAVPDDIFDKVPIFAVNPLVLNVPLATASVLTVNASASEMTAVDPFNVTPIFIVVTPGKTFPFDVIEKEPEVARKLTVQVPGFVSVMPVEKVIPP